MGTRHATTVDAVQYVRLEDAADDERATHGATPGAPLSVAVDVAGVALCSLSHVRAIGDRADAAHAPNHDLVPFFRLPAAILRVQLH